MIAALLVLALEAVAEVPPRTVAWDELDAGPFDPDWRLPPALDDPAAAFGPMLALAQARWTERETGATRCLGDLVLEHDALAAAARPGWRAQLLSRLDGLREPEHALLVGLLADERLRGSDWTSEVDRDDDGLLMFEEWTFGQGGGEPWRSLSVEPRFAQAAALVRADLASLRAVDNDYTTYFDHVDAEYEAIHPVEGSHVRGSGSAGLPFSGHALYFRCDLPFPFTDYECQLGILNWICDRGLARTDIYSASEDFHYLAGRDVVVPVETHAGEPVGLLVVRQFGFDLRRVPDGAAQRAEAVRGSLGNLKLKADRHFEGRSGDFDASPSAHTRYRVVGRR